MLAGGVLVIHWENGLSTRGSLAAIGAANPDASTVTLTQNHALEATNHGDGTWTLADNLLPALAAGVYDVQVTVWDRSEARAQDATLNELTIDLTPPVVDIVDVTPDPRNTAVNAISIVFSEAVAGFNLADLALTAQRRAEPADRQRAADQRRQHHLDPQRPGPPHRQRRQLLPQPHRRRGRHCGHRRQRARRQRGRLLEHDAHRDSGGELLESHRRQRAPVVDRGPRSGLGWKLYGRYGTEYRFLAGADPGRAG